MISGISATTRPRADCLKRLRKKMTIMVRERMRAENGSQPKKKAVRGRVTRMNGSSSRSAWRLVRKHRDDGDEDEGEQVVQAHDESRPHIALQKIVEENRYVVSYSGSISPMVKKPMPMRNVMRSTFIPSFPGHARSPPYERGI
jgi:hypothetical protein